MLHIFPIEENKCIKMYIVMFSVLTFYLHGQYGGNHEVPNDHDILTYCMICTQRNIQYILVSP